MPPLSFKRVLGRVLLAAAFLTLAMPAAAFAAAPQPMPGYQPTFVTEREADGVWEDCIWAAAAMLLDKWTNGSTTVHRERLRSLSGDKAGGSNLRDVQRAYSKIGMRLPISPYDDVAVSWTTLLERLAAGGGAIVLGDYGRLPARFGRWDPDFWSRKGTGDDHALYVDRYDRRTSSVLVMDPLAPQGWGGEWIPASALKKFAWRTSGGALSVAMTPPAVVPRPFEGVAVGAPTATADAGALHLAWPITQAPQGWTYPGANLSTQLARLAAIDAMAWIVAAPRADGTSAPLASSTTSVAESQVRALIPLPSPGSYALSVSLADRQFGEPIAAAGAINLYVPGSLAATYQVPATLSIARSQPGSMPITVTNVGSQSWAEPPVPWLPLAQQNGHGLRLMGTWVRQASATPDGQLPRPPAPFEIAILHLEAGDSQAIDAALRAPVDAGTWRLVLDLVSASGQSLALGGSAPGIVLVEVLAPGQVASGQ